jgi:hypothetical protein
VDAAAAAAATAGSDGQSERQEKARAWPRRYVRQPAADAVPTHSRTHALTHSRTRVPIQLSPPHWSDSCMACMLLLLLLLLAVAQVVVERAVVRSGWQLDSGKIGEMETGEELDVVESVTHPETGVERARFTYMGQDAWTSVASTNGVLILRQVE